VSEAEAAADDAAVGEEPLDLARRRRRRDVEVLRIELEQEITHAAADEIRRVVEARQALDDPDRVGVQVFEGDRMMNDLGAAMDLRRGGRRGVGGRGRGGLRRLVAQVFRPARKERLDLLENHAREL
jgi:hypothetical protein